MADRREVKEAAIFEQRGHIAIVTLNRPENANALNTQMHRDVCPMWDEINTNPDIKVAIVTGGTGRFFCAGRDVKEYVDFYADGDKTKVRPIDDPNDPMFGKLCNHYYVKKPLIAAINGIAVGGGLEIVIMTDLRVMADDTYLADLHAKVNVGGMNSLAHELPWPIANYLTMANGRLTAQQCLQFGFVNRIVPKAQVLDTAIELAEMVMTSGPDSIRHLKDGSLKRQIASGNIVAEGEERNRRGNMEERVNQVRAQKDLVEGMAAFVEKRTASYEKTS